MTGLPTGWPALVAGAAGDDWAAACLLRALDRTSGRALHELNEDGTAVTGVTW